MRHDVDALVRKIRGLDESLDLSITTNGYLLGKMASKLKDAGLDRVSVSCDSLVKHRFADMTLRDALDEVLEGLRISAELGLEPIKINCVVIRGHNEDEGLAFARLARDTGLRDPLHRVHASRRAGELVRRGGRSGGRDHRPDHTPSSPWCRTPTTSPNR